MDVYRCVYKLCMYFSVCRNLWFYKISRYVVIVCCIDYFLSIVWLFRKILKIPCTNGVTVEVLQRVSQRTVKCRKIQYVSCILGIIKDVNCSNASLKENGILSEEDFPGLQIYGNSFAELFRIAISKIRIAHVRYIQTRFISKKPFDR